MNARTVLARTAAGSAAFVIALAAQAAQTNPLEPDYYVGKPAVVSEQSAPAVALVRDDATKTLAQAVNPLDPGYYVGRPAGSRGYVGTGSSVEVERNPLNPAYKFP